MRIRVCHVDDLPPAEAMQVPLDPPIAVFNVGGAFFATDDLCTHGNSSLSDGYIDGDFVECSFHFAKFCIRSGEARTLPATIPLRTYAVEVVDGEVFLDVRR